MQDIKKEIFGGNIEEKKDEWDPYDPHGGTHCECVGEDFVCIAADTRLSSNYAIKTRHKCRIYQMNSKTAIIGCGFEADLDAFITRMKMVSTQYEQQHFKELTVESLARAVANTLYSRRFFPFYVMVSVCGIDEQGRGRLFSYDEIGTIEDVKYNANGSGTIMAMPILDHYFGSIRHNTEPYKNPTRDEASNLLREIICSVAERDIETGDSVQIAFLDAKGLTITDYPLPRH